MSTSVHPVRVDADLDPEGGHEEVRAEPTTEDAP